MRPLRIALAIAAASAFWSVPALARVTVLIDSCYQDVGPHELGVLTQDIDCDGSGGPDLTMEPGAKLQMNGHHIAGGYLGIAIETGEHKTVIVGQGSIYGQSGSGPVSGCGISTGSSTVIESVDVHDSRCGIVAIYTHPIKLKLVNVYDNAEDGVTWALPVDTGKVKATAFNAVNNGGYGVKAYSRLTLKSAQVLNNAGGGASAGQILKASMSTLTGNGPGADVAAGLKVKLTNTTCDHSLVTALGANDTFHVCALDAP